MTLHTNGGKRPGAGRPAGSRNRRTLEREALANETAVKLMAAGVSNSGPISEAEIAKLSAIEVMSYAMVNEAIAGRWLVAADIAAKIAPYRHAKLTNVHVDANVTSRNLEELSDAELQLLLGSDDEANEAAD